MIKRAIILILILGGLYWLTTSFSTDPAETVKNSEIKTEETEKGEDKEVTTDKKDESEAKTEKTEEAATETKATEDKKVEEASTEVKKEAPVETKTETPKITEKAEIVTPKEEVVAEKEVTKPAPRAVYYPNRTTAVKVYLYEWAVDISSKEIPSGTVQFEVINNGKFSHDFSIRGVKNFGKVTPRQTVTFTTKFLPGSFEIFSGRRDDYENGMKEGITIVK